MEQRGAQQRRRPACVQGWGLLALLQWPLGLVVGYLVGLAGGGEGTRTGLALTALGVGVVAVAGVVVGGRLQRRDERRRAAALEETLLPAWQRRESAAEFGRGDYADHEAAWHAVRERETARFAAEMAQVRADLRQPHRLLWMPAQYPVSAALALFAVMLLARAALGS